MIFSPSQPAHSKLGASSASRWMNCPGSVRLSEGIESKSSKYAEEGTLAHEVAALVLEGATVESVDPEMMDHLKVYIDSVLENVVMKKHLYVEVRFDLSSVYPGMFGTADAVTYDPDKKLLRVFDLKYGAGLPVEVKNNPQLKYYALGAMTNLGVPANRVEVVIVQPRCQHEDGPVRRWDFDAIDLIDFAADLKEAATRTEDINAALNPGSHCKFCPASGICPALANRANALARTEFAPSLSYDPKALAKALDAVEEMQAWIEGVRKFAYAEAEHGRPPPGYKLVQKRAIRRWRNEVEASMAMASAFKLTSEEIFTQKIKSPAQIEKMVKGGKEIIEAFTIKESSGFALAKEDDDRPAAKLDAKTEFTVLSEEFLSH